MSAEQGPIDDLAADLVTSSRARQLLIADPRQWCGDHLLGPGDVVALTSCIRRRAEALEPAERRVVLAVCFALGAAARD